MPAERHHRYIILGAGAAGLSLCYQLLQRGVRAPILILDRKPSFGDDRTWCFWESRPAAFTGLAARCWHRWDVFDAQGGRTTRASEDVGYACLRGADFYAHILDEIRRHDNVTLNLGCPVEGHQSFPAHVEIRAGETYTADYAFDSRPVEPTGGGIYFSQRFFGQIVRTEQPRFDPARCTLMDFRAPQGRGLHFFYVLPFSPTEALIENTYLQGGLPPAPTVAEHRAEIAAYLAAHHGLTDFAVTHEEAGAIPMTTRAFPRRDGRVFFIGTAGGCTKPSSGYTFARIQEQCRQIAASASAGTLDGFRERLAPARYHLFDAVFLQAMHDRPRSFPDYFRRLFAHVPPAALAAFLSEAGTWRDDLAIIRSLPLGPFLGAAVRSMPGLLPWARG